MISVNKKKIDILSIILFCGITLLTLPIQVRVHKITYIDPTHIIAVFIISYIFIHEGFHYLGFIVFGKLKPNQIVIKNDKSSILPYVRIKDGIPVRKFVQALLLPSLVFSIITFYLIFKSSNILFSYLLGYVVSMGTGDYLLALEMLKLDKDMLVVSNEDVFGVEKIK